jgi:hypothetical protein
MVYLKVQFRKSVEKGEGGNRQGARGNRQGAISNLVIKQSNNQTI